MTLSLASENNHARSAVHRELHIKDKAVNALDKTKDETINIEKNE